METIKTRHFLIAVFVLSLLIGLSYVLCAPPRPAGFDDSASWDAVAWNVRSGNGFTEADGNPTSVRPPIYPLFLASIFFAFGHNLLIVKIAQALINAFIIVFACLIALEIFNKKIAQITGILLCFYPPLIVYTGIIGSETLFTLLITIVIYAIIVGLKKENILVIVIAVLLTGVTNLCRSTLLFYPFFLSVGIYLLLRKKYSFLTISRSLILLIFITFIPVIPWTVRNYFTFGKLLLVNVSSGELLWAGSYLPWDGISKTDRDADFYKLFAVHKIKNPVVLEKNMQKEAFKNITSHPAGFLKLTVKKFFRFWFQPVGQELVSKKSKVTGYLMYFFHALWLLFAVIGFYVSKDRRIIYMPITVLFIYFTIMHNLVAPIARYRLPIEPLIMIFAACGLYHLLLKKGNLKS
ncbi:MAG: glycosyltransferase family 39 protein [Elusimicrobia bacterium]|nr:glycosyltransferase family 39 protein [Elusimicrobiota bacterium]MBU2614438.1 glycosyltransferase family 39 protein [Elusimicrobiota bacterium]